MPPAFLSLYILPALPYIIDSGYVYPLVLSEGGYLLFLALVFVWVLGQGEKHHDSPIGRPTYDREGYIFISLKMKVRDSVNFSHTVLSSLKFIFGGFPLFLRL